MSPKKENCANKFYFLPKKQTVKPAVIPVHITDVYGNAEI
jgi:hypothetical protein